MDRKVRSTESVNLRQSKEAKSAQVLLKGLDALTFDARAFAFQVMTANSMLQRRVMKVIIAILEMWSQKYRMGTWIDEDEMELTMQAHRIVEYLSNFDNLDWENKL